MRKGVHKFNCNNINSNDYNVYIYEFIRNNGGWEKWEMQSIEHLQCNNKYEATIKEREYIDQFNANLNYQIPTRTAQERNKFYYQNNKIKISEYMKQYHNKNKIKISDYMKQYRNKNKEKLYEQQKQYYEKNKEKINKQQKQYYEENKEKLDKQRKQYNEKNKGKLTKYAYERYHQKKLLNDNSVEL